MSYPNDAEPCQHLVEGSQTTYVVWGKEALCLDCLGSMYERTPTPRFLDAYELYLRTRGRSIDMRHRRMVHG